MRGIILKLIFALAIFMVATTVSCTGPSSEESGQVSTAGNENPVIVPTTTNDRFRFYEIEKVSETENEDILAARRYTLALGIKIQSDIHSAYTVNNTDVNVITLVPENSGDIIGLYSGIFTFFDSMDYTVVLGTGGISIIESDDPFAADVVRYELDLVPLQKIKMTPHTLYGEAEFVGEALIIGDRLESMAADLGFGLDMVLNQEILLGGQTVRVNFIDPADDVGALRAMDALAVRKRSDEGIYILDDYVIEVATQDWETAENIWKLINIPPLSRNGTDRFTVEFSAVPIDARDYGKLPELNSLAISGVSTENLSALDPLLVFNGSLPLFLCQERTSVVIIPEGIISLVDESIASVTFDIEQADSNPEVRVEMVVETGNHPGVGPEFPLPYTARTSFWPVGEDMVRAIVRGCLDSMESEGYYAVAVSLSGWVHGHILSSESESGNRETVEAAIAQGYGDSWTRSDVFITLSRTAGLPARQIAGWQYGVGPKVWSQVWLPDEGYWLDIDTEREKIGIDSFYIPIWGTRDGRMAFLYTEGPLVRRFSGR